MKKMVISVLFVTVPLIMIVLSVCIVKFEKKDIKTTYGLENYEQGLLVSVAHRAVWEDGAPENSLVAIASAINKGIDSVEIDVEITSDGVIVLLHDSTIDRTTSGTGSVNGMTWDTLKNYGLEKGTGNNDAYLLTAEDVVLLKSLPNYVEHCGEAVVGGTMPVTRLDDAIDLINQLDDRAMINLDHCWNEELFSNCYVAFREAEMLDRVLFKNTATPDKLLGLYIAAKDAWNEKYPNNTITTADVIGEVLCLEIIKSADPTQLQNLLDAGINLAVAEIVIEDDTVDAEVKAKLEPWCKANNVKMYINTMWAGLCSDKGDTETTWAEMIDRGYSIIQTDRPNELASYLYDFNRTRASNEVIQAEHFNLFNYESYGFNVPASVEYDKNLNKMHNGDWISYKLSFNGDETFLNLYIKCLDASAKLNVYLDEIKTEKTIASSELGAISPYETLSVELTGAVSEGEHTLYIQADGQSDVDLLSIDNFTFAASSNSEAE